MMTYNITVRKTNFGSSKARPVDASTDLSYKHDRLLRCSACRLKYEYHTLTQIATHYICKFCMKDWGKNYVQNN